MNQYRGLKDSEVLSSRAKYGNNTLTPPIKPSLWHKFLEKFSDPIIIILLVALTLSVGVAIYQYASGLEGAHVFLEPVGIFVAVILATLIGFLFEVNADKKFEVLNRVNDDSLVKVKRDGEIRELPKRDVVVGDIILLESGEEIPADCLLVESVSFMVNESTLTGEPLTYKSTREEDFEIEATYPTNQVMRGSIIVEGHAIAQALKVGDQTEYGKVYRGLQMDSGIKTPLNQQLDRLAALITKVSYGVALFIIAGRLWLYFSGLNGFEWVEFGGYLLNTIMIAVTVIVVSVPEGLPMSVTLSLALSMQRMMRENNLVRKMHACETMGAATVICTDKTGTLTQNKMQVFQTQFLDNEAICNAIAINSTAHLERLENRQSKVIGNPTEGALLLWLEAQNIDYLKIRAEHKIIEQLPFSTERKYMATMVSSEQQGKNIIYIKGAPEVVMALSNHREDNTNTTLAKYQSMAMRTLAFAAAEIDDRVEPFTDNRLIDIDFSFQGVVAISDPIRAGVPSAIDSCQSAGIAIKIVTGDTSATAKEIGRQIGLWSNTDTELSHLTGAEFETLSDRELLDRVKSLKIISRARPMDKERLVRLLQERGEVVAVTGDGTNDAPALKAAQIGLSMGDGTMVAKEASDITILDNSFSSITHAVMWGRSLYQNIQRFVLFQLTINLVACIIVLIGAFTGAESPLTVTQMLWVNLIMDTFAALALASLPPSERVMRAKPRSSTAHIITPSISKGIIGVGLLFVVILFGLMQYFRGYDIISLSEFNIAQYFESYLCFTHNGFSTYEMSLFFTIFVMMQFWNIFNAKAFMSGGSAFRALGRSRGFITTALLILVGQWFIVTFGSEMFNVKPLAFEDWMIIIVATSPILFIGELWRFVRSHGPNAIR
ncbi:MAG: calcium-translocating P-type ATPase, PMCA-type [Rikenellaceae bacterium]